MSKTIVLIPARMASTRLPGKPLADIHGEPMIVHVWRRGMEAQIGEVVVATDSEPVAAAVEKAGGKIAGEGGAADLLGMKPSTLTYQLRTFNIGRRS